MLVYRDMTRAHRRSRLVLVCALAFGSLASSPAQAREAKELRVPPAPSQDLADTLAAAKAKLPAELQAAFAAVVADAQVRLLASERAAADGSSERLAVEDAVRAALVDADFAGVAKGKSKVLTAYVAMVTLQLAFDLRRVVRDRMGRQLAVRAVHACKGAAACLDAIAPTPDMPAEQVAAVRKQFDGNAKDLEAEDRLGNFEIQQLLGVVARVKTSDRMQKAVLDFIKG
jgi:hypothetical protein